MEHNSFILYRQSEELIDMLNDEDCGKLMRALFVYARTKTQPDLPPSAKIVFTAMRQYLDENDKKWTEMHEKRIQAGRNSGRVRRAASAKRSSEQDDTASGDSDDDDADADADADVDMYGAITIEEMMADESMEEIDDLYDYDEDESDVLWMDEEPGTERNIVPVKGNVLKCVQQTRTKRTVSVSDSVSDSVSAPVSVSAPAPVSVSDFAFGSGSGSAPVSSFASVSAPAPVSAPVPGSARASGSESVFAPASGSDHGVERTEQDEQVRYVPEPNVPNWTEWEPQEQVLEQMFEPESRSREKENDDLDDPMSSTSDHGDDNPFFFEPSREHMNQTSLSDRYCEVKQKDYIRTGEPYRAVQKPNSSLQEGIVPFAIPRFDEVAAYCREQRLYTDPERFYRINEANGWTVGGRPMRDWRAALRGWSKTDRDRSRSMDTGRTYARSDGSSRGESPYFGMEPPRGGEEAHEAELARWVELSQKVPFDQRD